MLLIGVDYHPSFQQIAVSEAETGERGQRQLNYTDGEAERFYRNLQQQAIRGLVSRPYQVGNATNGQNAAHSKTHPQSAEAESIP